MTPFNISSYPTFINNGYGVGSKEINLVGITEGNFQKITLPASLGICIVGVLANIVTVTTFVKMGLGDSITIVFFNLAISDLLVVFMGFLHKTFCLLRLLKIVNSMYPGLYHIEFAFLEALGSLSESFTDSTAFLTTFIAVQRCLCVAKPLHFKTMFNRRRTYMIMLVLWGFSSILLAVKCYASIYSYNFIPLFNMSALMLNGLQVHLGENLDFVISLFLRPSCFLTSLVCAFITGHVLFKSVEFRQKIASSSNSVPTQGPTPGPATLVSGKNEGRSATSRMSSSKERQAIVQVTLLLVIFLVTNIPQMLSTFDKTTFVTTHVFLFTDTSPLFRSVLLEMAQTALLVNSSVNLFVYYKYNTKFRQLCFPRRPSLNPAKISAKDGV